MSAEATGWVWKHSPYSGAQLLVHLAIADVVNDLHDYKFWMSTDQLAKKAKVSRSSVVATLSDMVERGLLVVLEHGAASRKPSTYQWTSAVSAHVRPGASAVSNITRPNRASATSAVTAHNSIDKPNERAASQLSTGQTLRAELDHAREHAVPPPKRDKSKPLTALKETS